MISSIDAYVLTVNLSWNTINRTHSYMYFKALFLKKRAAALAIKGCAFAGIAIVQ